MDLDLFLVGDALFHEEHGNVLSEVSLQLDNHALFLVLDHGTVAMEHLLEGSQELLVIEVIRETLDNGQTLSCGTLLVVQI